MRKDDLKNRLDQRPLSFNKEDLWNKIDSNSAKKRRRPLFWWFWGVGAAIIIVIAGLKWTYSDTGMIHEKEMANVQKSENIESIKSEDLTSEPSLSKIEKGNELNSSHPIFDKGFSDIQNPEQTETNLKSTKIEDMKNSNGDIVGYEFFGNEKPGVEKEQTLLNESNLKTDSNIGKNRVFTESIDDKSINSENRFIPKKRSVTNSVIPINGIAITEFLISYELVINPKRAQPMKPETHKLLLLNNRLQFGIGIGSDKHTFKQDGNYNRFAIENNLESLFASLNYQRHLRRNLLLSSGVSFISSQTQVLDSRLNSNQYIRSIQDGKTYEITTETNRSLFNRYSRLDVSLGLEYILGINDWQLIGVVGVGTNLKSFYSGDVITNNGKVVALSDLDIYKERIGAFYNYGLKIERSVQKSISIGLFAQLQGERNLVTVKDEHVIKPFLFNLYLSKEW